MKKLSGWSRVAGCLAGLLVLGAAGCRRGGEESEVRVSQAESVAGEDVNPYGARDRAGYTPVQPGTGASGEERADGSRAAPEGRPEYPVAIAVPGKPGLVFNPHTNGIVDVRGVNPGTLVKDPQDPDQSHMFRVPE